MPQTVRRVRNVTQLTPLKRRQSQMTSGLRLSPSNQMLSPSSSILELRPTNENNMSGLEGTADLPQVMRSLDHSVSGFLE